MPQVIRFKFNIEKVKNLLIILCRSVPELDVLKIVKLFYLIDKQHLLRYGRIVTGDMYYKLDYGPVPSKTYDILKDIRGDRTPVYGEESKLIAEAVQPESLDPTAFFKTKAKPDLNAFSKNESDVIQSMVKKYGNKTGADLMDITHKDATYIKASRGSPIDFYLFFENEKVSSDVISIMEEEQENRNFLDDLK